jgi:hypothetical protein
MMHILERDCVLDLQPIFVRKSYTEEILVSSSCLIHPLISGHIYFLFVMSIFIASVVSL